MGYRVNVQMMDIKPFIKQEYPETEPLPCRIFNKRRSKRTCDECDACKRMMDCGKCDFCRDKPKFGGRNLKRQKCRWRQCHLFSLGKMQIGHKIKEPNVATKRFNKIKYLAAFSPPRRVLKRRRFKRTCNKCGPCKLEEDCAQCDFCLDKPKFGGPNLKHQKCRLRQCKYFALKHLCISGRRRPQVDHDDEWEWDRAKRRQRMKKVSARKKLKTLHPTAQWTPKAAHTHMRTLPQVVVKEAFVERYLNVEDHRIVFKEASVLLKRLEDIIEIRPLVKEERNLNTEDHQNLKVASVLLKRLEDYIEYEALVKEARRGRPFTVPVKDHSTEHEGVLDPDVGLVGERYLNTEDHQNLKVASVLLKRLEDYIEYEALVKEARRGRPFTVPIKEDSTEHEGVLDGGLVETARNCPRPSTPEEDCMESVPDDEERMLVSATSETSHLDIEDFLIKGDEEEFEDGDRLPVITQVVSIGGGMVLSHLKRDGRTQGSNPGLATAAAVC